MSYGDKLPLNQRVIHLHDECMPYDSDLGKFDNVIGAVTLYEDHGYEGSGWIIAFTGEHYLVGSLSHCSCYGPFDDFPHTKGCVADLAEAVNFVNHEIEYGDDRKIDWKRLARIIGHFDSCKDYNGEPDWEI